MRLSLLPLLLGLGTAAFCQTVPPAVVGPESGQCQSSPPMVPGDGWMAVPDCGRSSPQAMPRIPSLTPKPLGKFDPKFAVPFPRHIDPKIAVPFTAEIDPRFVMHPPQSSIGALQPGTPVVPKLYPDLKLQLIRTGGAAGKTGK